MRPSAVDCSAGTQFTCFTSTKVQILTQRAVEAAARDTRAVDSSADWRLFASQPRIADAHDVVFVLLCTSNACKYSKALRVAGPQRCCARREYYLSANGVSIRTFVPVKQVN